MSTSSYSRAHRFAAFGFLGCLALMVVGGMLSSGGHSNAEDRSGDEPTAAPTSPTTSALTSASPPTTLRIPDLHLKVRVQRLGADAGGKNLALPPVHAAGWDATSVTPGQVGVSVVVGFIERKAGQPGALSHLRRLGRGDAIVVRRKDGAAARYRVTRIAFYPQGKLPSDKVFAPVARPELRLVSLGGPLHRGDPVGNAVVFATLAG